jgi:hypothetical protein
MIFTAKQRSEDGLRVAAARGNHDAPRDWHRMTVCWKDGRGQVESDQATTADEAMRWIGVLPAELDGEQMAQWLTKFLAQWPTNWRPTNFALPQAHGRLLARPVGFGGFQYRNVRWIKDSSAQRLAIGCKDLFMTDDMTRRPRPVVLVDVHRNRPIAILPTSNGAFSMPLAFSHNGE